MCAPVRLVARSISRPAREALRQPFHARVLAVFELACDLVTESGEVFALVTPQVGDGPLNIVVERPHTATGPQRRHGARSGDQDHQRATARGWSDLIEVGTPVTGAHPLRVGPIEVTVEGATVWEPRPDWETLRARREVVAGRVLLLREIVQGGVPPESMLAQALSPTARAAAEALRAGWACDPHRLSGGAAHLAGLGGGLTPAGDDFLCGAMLWAWLAHADPQAFCRTVVEAAAPRTTTLSAALLRAAGRGQCNAAWQRLLGTLAGGQERETAAATRAVLAYGATSGSDTLAGFLWMARAI